MRIGIDLDGVCYDFTNTLRIWRHVKRGIPLSDMPEASSWHFYSEQWGMTTEEFLADCAAAVLDGTLFWSGPAYPDATDTIPRLAQDHHIVIITDRAFPGAENECRLATEFWLADVARLPYDELHFTSDKTSVPVHTMVDDRPENYLALRSAGVDAWLLARHHNYTSGITHRRQVPHLWAYEEVVNG